MAKKRSAKNKNRVKSVPTEVKVQEQPDVKKKTKSTILFVMLAVTVLAFGAAFFVQFGKTGSAQASSENMTLMPENELTAGQARHFEYTTTDATKVRLFVVRDGRNKIRAALDACEVCWRAGKGYTQDNGVMVCNNCGRRFPLERIGEERGGCNPHPLTVSIREGKVEVLVKEIVAGRNYFNL